MSWGAANAGVVLLVIAAVVVVGVFSRHDKPKDEIQQRATDKLRMARTVAECRAACVAVVGASGVGSSQTYWWSFGVGKFLECHCSVGESVYELPDVETLCAVTYVGCVVGPSPEPCRAAMPGAPLCLADGGLP